MTKEQAVNRKARVGVVVSDVNDQTVVVQVERAARHRLYRKVLRTTKKYHVHDPENQATRGDLVRIEECRPISKLKRFRLVEVLTERAVADVAPESIGQELVEDVQRSAARAVAEETDESTSEAPSAESTAEVLAAVTDEAPAKEAAESVVAEASAEVTVEEVTQDGADAADQKAE
jgi:small subunit ribosomal protein S17